MMQAIIQAVRNMYYSGLLLDEVFHGLVSLPFCALLWIKTKKIKYAIIPLLVVYIIDSDHLFDYWLHYGLSFDPLKFVDASYFFQAGKAHIPFHAWEWVIFLGIYSYRKGWRNFTTALTLGMAAHLIWDTITFGNVGFYFIIYRALNGFSIFL